MFLMIIFQCFIYISNELNIHYVKPTRTISRCTRPCFYFGECLKKSKNCFKSNHIVYFLPGRYHITKTLMIKNIANISILAMYNQPTIFSCGANRYYFAITSTANVTMNNMMFKACGARLPVSLHMFESAALVFKDCSSIQLSNISYENTYGYGLMIINPKKSSIISNITFFQSIVFLDRSTLIGMFVYFEKVLPYFHTSLTMQQPEKISLVLQNCSFLNYDDRIEFCDVNTNSNAMTLHLVIHDQQINVTLSIINITFSNCNCVQGSLINVSLPYYGSSQIYFKDTKLLGNIATHLLGDAVIYIEQTSQGERTLFDNSTSYFGHRLHFEKCHISSNRMFKYIMQLNFTDDKNYATNHKKGNMLPFNLFITKTTFRSNEARKGLLNINPLSPNKLKFYNSTNTVLFATVTISNCSFISNKNMVVEFYYIKKIMILGQNIFSNNTVYSNSSLMIIHESDSYFSGATKFTDNNITGVSVMTFKNYINLLVNASLHFKSNYFMNRRQPSNSFALINNEFCSDEYCPCAIQFRSLKKDKSDVEVTSFSLTFKNNTANNQDAKILYGKNFRDCFWLPDALFSVKHPSELFKSVIQYNGNDVNPSGYPYNLCICRESINCIEDRIFDDGVYPGQMLNISFALVDTASKQVVVDLLVSPVQNIKPFPCIIEESQLRQLLTTNCSPVKYTVSVYNKSITKCSIQLQYVLDFPVLNVYYLKILPCPAGFTFIDQKCQCNPVLQYITPHPICYINNQSVYRPANSWLSFSEESNDILYVEFCPLQHCLPKDSFIHLLHSDMQCKFNRGGPLCGKCPSGLSSVFGSSKCKKCSNTWLASILLFAVAGLLLVLVLFLSKITIKDGSINGFILYVNILSITSHNMFTSDSDITTSFAYILISLANLDLGFDLCFYNGMTEYSKTWLQLAFPLYLLCLAGLIIQISRHIHKLSRLTGNNTISVLGTLFLLSYNKILLVSCRGLFFYTQVTSLESRRKETFWLIDTNVPLFGVKFFCLLIGCLALFVALIIPLNLILLLPKLSYRIKYVHYFKPLLDVYQGAFKDNHRYWFGLELILRVVIFGVTALDSEISLLLNVLILAGIIIYLSYVQPFNSLKNSLLEWSFLMNAIVLLTFTFYYGKYKTEIYFRLLNSLIVMAFMEFVGIILFHPFLHISKPLIQLCRKKILIFQNFKSKYDYEMNPYQNLNIPDVTYNYIEFQEELLGEELDS